MKPLSDYIEAIESLVVDRSIFVPSLVQQVTNNSRLVSDNSIFVAIKGAAFDGHNYISDAIARGAKTVVYSSSVESVDGVNYIRVSDAYRAYALLAECYYDFPSRNFNLSGITGTNGKTTTAFLLKEILCSAKSDVGLISTVEYRCGETVEIASRTTPEAGELQRLFASMRDANCSDVVMEVSSHGLDQHRTGAARFKVGIFTNLSGDHLDYHGTMEEYFKAKERLFSEALDDTGVAIVNADDIYGKRLSADLSGDVLSYGKGEDCRCRIVSIETKVTGSVIDIILDGNELALHSSLIGEYNAYNIAAAVSAAYILGLDLDVIYRHFSAESTHNVPGRMEVFHIPNGSTVFVDYAHTDDALQNVLKTLKPLTKERLIVVFGCGGDRDVTKRPRMGQAASALADVVVITSDNPRSEDPSQIIEQIKTGICPGCNCVIIEDREKAIVDTINSAQKGDVILVAGKGHEAYQEINGVFHNFDDREIISRTQMNL